MALQEKKWSEIWILGGGKFGRISAEAVRRIHPEARIIVVDSDPEACRELARLSFATVYADGVAYILEHLKRGRRPDWIVPVIPVHVACEWAKAEMASGFHISSMPVPDDAKGRVPNPMNGSEEEVYMSLAEFECPENCPEPSTKCTVTGRERPYRLYEMLAGVPCEGFRSVVVRSRQLAPGVGGFRPDALYRALSTLRQASGPVLFSTACSCHGVMNALLVSRQPS